MATFSSGAGGALGEDKNVTHFQEIQKIPKTIQKVSQKVKSHPKKNTKRPNNPVVFPLKAAARGGSLRSAWGHFRGEEVPGGDLWMVFD